jgi:very-short-patch-repair endonuclease
MESKTDLYRHSLHKNFSPYVFDYAKKLRREATEAERILWEYLKNRKLNGKKFRRQHVIDKFILDFYCHESRLAIELDGAIHTKESVREYDEIREAHISEHHIKIIRFQNEDILFNIKSVLEEIIKNL